VFELPPQLPEALAVWPVPRAQRTLRGRVILDEALQMMCCSRSRTRLVQIEVF
jgi:hypothetical protein